MAHISVSGETRTPIGSHAPLDMPIVVGFGCAKITKDGELFFDGEKSWDIKQLEEIEAVARESPESCWRCIMDAPLWSASWERNEKGEWVCYESGEGFA